jgi:polyadenylate-binding protein
MSSASLYVGDLADDVTEPMLFEIFSHVGPVASVRVCRDAVTRRSLGYAYVNFHNMTDAERALDTLNYSEVRGRPCRIMWKHRDPSIRKAGVGNVFIKNLDKSLDTRHLNDTFSAFGNIVSCKVAVDEKGESKGHGYVQYETKEEADAAVSSVNGMLIMDKKVYVGPFIPRNDRDKLLNSDNTFTNIYIKNLEEEITDEEFNAMFGKFGEITSCKVMRNEEGKSKGFGFINFKANDAAKSACEQMNGATIKEKVLYCGRAEKKSKREADLRKKFEARRAEQQAKYQGVNLFVKNLDDTVDDEKLKTAFAPYGTITSVKVMSDEKAHTKGFGFVCFSTPEEANRAVTGMNSQMFGTKPIYVALHQTREIRKAQLQAQFAQRNSMAPAGMQRQMMPVPGQMPMFYQPAPGQAGGRQMFMFPQVGAQQMGQPQRYVQPRMVPAGNRQTRQQFRNNQQRGFKYTTNVRNRDQPGAPGAAAPVAVPAQEPLSVAVLAAATPAQAKQMLGERLFGQIVQSQPQLAGKVTGMLLELDNTELLHLIESPEALNGKIGEALTALEAAAAEAAE